MGSSVACLQKKKMKVWISEKLRCCSDPSPGHLILRKIQCHLDFRWSKSCYFFLALRTTTLFTLQVYHVLSSQLLSRCCVQKPLLLSCFLFLISCWNFPQYLLQSIKSLRYPWMRTTLYFLFSLRGKMDVQSWQPFQAKTSLSLYLFRNQFHARGVWKRYDPI